jgi:regulatory protein
LNENSQSGRSLKARALSFLAMREHTRAELARKLKAHAESEEELVATLQEVEASGWLSDQRAAESIIRAKSARYGRSHVAAVLRQKGVDSDTAAKAIADLDDAATAQAIWQKKFGVPPADAKERARHIRFLVSRGFGMDIAMRVVKGSGLVEDSAPDEFRE